MPKQRSQASSTDKPQIDKFREAARELETDNSEERFDRTLKKLVKAPSTRNEAPADRDD